MTEPVRYAMVREADASGRGDARRIDARVSVELPGGLPAVVECSVSPEEWARLLPGRFVAVRVVPARSRRAVWPYRAVPAVDVSRAAQVRGLARQKRSAGLLLAEDGGVTETATVRELRPRLDRRRGEHVLTEIVLADRTTCAYGYYLPEQLVAYAPGTAVRFVSRAGETSFVWPDPEVVTLDTYR